MDTTILSKGFLHHYGTTNKMYCAHCFMMMRKGFTHSKEYALFPMPCKRWSCSVCGKKKAWMYSKRITEAFQQHRARFMTLTLAEVSDPLATVRIMAGCWNLLRLRLKRHFGKCIYARFLEYGGKNGRPHYHILVNKYIPQKWLSKVAYECGFGKIVDIRLPPKKAIVKYCTKYLSKDLVNIRTQKFYKNQKVRRVVCSREVKLNPKSNAGWQAISIVEQFPYTDKKDFQNKMRLVQNMIPGTTVEPKHFGFRIHLKDLEPVHPKGKLTRYAEINLAGNYLQDNFTEGIDRYGVYRGEVGNGEGYKLTDREILLMECLTDSDQQAEKIRKEKQVNLKKQFAEKATAEKYRSGMIKELEKKIDSLPEIKPITSDSDVLKLSEEYAILENLEKAKELEQQRQELENQIKEFQKAATAHLQRRDPNSLNYWE